MELHMKARSQLSPKQYESYCQQFDRKQKRIWLTWTLLILLGWLGGHKLYLGNRKGFIIYIGTCGLLGIGLVYDLFTLTRQIHAANATVATRLLHQLSP